MIPKYKFSWLKLLTTAYPRAGPWSLLSPPPLAKVEPGSPVRQGWGSSLTLSMECCPHI